MNKKLKRVGSIHRKKKRILKSRIKEQKAKAQTERKTKAAEHNVKAVHEPAPVQTPAEPVQDAPSGDQA
ncbi:MAG: hypothetical protein ACHQJ4_01840 [Ignavibacteria bacterium]